MDKGQSAIEYLTTYGWMLLVVAIAGGSLFSVIKDQDVKLSSDISSPDIGIENFGLNSDGLSIVVRSTSHKILDIEEIELYSRSSNLTSISDRGIVSPAGASTFNIAGVSSSDSINEIDIEVRYDKGPLANMTAKGTIVGNLKVVNYLDIVKASFNYSREDLDFSLKNKGDDPVNSVDYNLQGKDGSAGSLETTINPEETSKLSVPVSVTSSLNAISLEPQGQNFKNSDEKLECVPINGLTGYWPLNNNSTKSGYAVDISRNGNNGSLTEVATGVKGKLGEAYEFNGSSQIKVPISENLRSDQYSISMWVEWSEFPNTGSFDNLIFTEGYWGPVLAEVTGYNELRLRIGQSDGTFSTIETDQILQKNKWYHVLFKIDKNTTTGNTQLKTYLNGKLEANNTVGQDWSKEDIQYWKFGKDTPDNAHIGRLDDLRIYDKLLSVAEIQRLSNTTSNEMATEACALQT